jgi:hypothetical protein
MTIAVHLDEDARGNFGIVKEIKRPQKIPFSRELFLDRNENEGNLKEIDLNFNIMNAIVVFENDKLHIKNK